jgi:hypothetical protein
MQILRWLPFFIRHPRILLLIIQALNRKVKIVGPSGQTAQ